MSLGSNNMIGPDVFEIQDIDFYLDGEGVHSSDLFEVYDPLDEIETGLTKKN
ncbi:hypothetical protein HRED_04849 [Candidatus Haloredivivus sp. G17]|nr:hypothetical protein HRED_04849 [Candidatus Haloredivivus sp. G17]